MPTTLLLRSCASRSAFRSAQQCSSSRKPLPPACKTSSTQRRAAVSPAAAQPTGLGTSRSLMTAMLSASTLLQTDAAWSHFLQTELPQATLLYELADLDAKTAGAIARVLQPVLAISQLLMIARIVLSWYPQVNSKKLPWSIAVIPTEPVLGPTRRLIPPVGGVDISPIIWFAFLSFTNEILIGPQGILNLLQRKIS